MLKVNFRALLSIKINLMEKYASSTLIQRKPFFLRHIQEKLGMTFVFMSTHNVLLLILMLNYNNDNCLQINILLLSNTKLHHLNT